MARAKRASIRDVAVHAGVSVSTVSLVLNDRGRVGPDARARVRDAVVELGYRPNPSAQNMRRQRTGIIGIIERTAPGSSWDWTDLEFVVRLTHAACSAAWAKGWYPTLLPGEIESTSLAQIPMDRAILIDPIPGDDDLRTLEELQIPTVTMGRDIGRDVEVGNWVDHDKRLQCRTALDVLARGGARRRMMISANTGQSYMADNVAGFRETLGQGGPDLLIETSVDVTAADIFALVQRHLAGPDPVDGIYVVVEAYLQPILDAIQDLGLSVPDDVQLITSSDSAATRSARVPVSSFDLRPEALGGELIDILHGLDELPDTRARRIISPELLLRGSTTWSP